MTRRCVRAVALVASTIVLGCAAPGSPASEPPRPPASASGPTGTTDASPPAVEGDGVGAIDPLDPRALLAPMAIDDGPAPGGYLRDLFPTWKDVDHDGCDARRQALIAASTTPAQTGERCAVVSGSWTSAYDGATTTDPADVQIDHVVPLANAWRSGADTWTTDRRTQFANDQLSLWAVSASANRSKGDSGPERWRPPRQEVWCEYAQRWTAIKVRWHLTATTAERDALGQMLDTC